MDHELSDSNQDHQDTPVSYVSGLLGAVAGALIGGIPWGILIYYGWFVGWLAFIIGFASFCGYKLLRGPKNFTIAMVLICAASFASAILWTFMMIIYHGVTVELGLDFHFEYFFTIPREIPNFFSLFLEDLWIPLLITAAGLWGINKTVRTYTSPETLENEIPVVDIEVEEETSEDTTE
ncbi:MAG: hypothetical protein FWC68_02740 [Oscillospiraceae bacterium]|nr:hypothetical protein [Oscillospiraceae bacterium]